jgi:hypothetical protein
LSMERKITLEKQIQQAILDYCFTKRLLAWRIPLSAAMYTKPDGELVHRRNPMAGFPDIAVVVGGRLIAIEVKRPKGVLSQLQRDWIEKLEQAGAIAGVATSVDEAEKLIARACA